jgi:hypothetical protein
MELKNVTIKSIDQLKTFDSGFTCVDFVVTTDEQYPQTLKLQANKEKAENLIKYNKPGDKVDISINLRGREWTNPSPADSWHHRNGYINKAAVEGFIHSKTNGQIARLTHYF